MAPHNNSADLLQGLNLIQTPQIPTNDAEILSAGPYGDLAAQLDLWTNVSFASDEPFVSSQDLNPEDGDGNGEKGNKDADLANTASEVVKRKRDLLAGKKMQQLQREQQQQLPTMPTYPPTAPTTAAPYDFPSFFNMAAAGNQFPAQSLNLNQLLALQAFPNPFQAAFGSMPSFTPPLPAMPPAPAPTTSRPEAAPSAKRAKTRKPSVARATSTVAPDSPEASQTPLGDEGEQDDDSSRPVNTGEDKRRRNTQASARFRLKKKEREQAMEVKSKELETKVGELEKECEALRRENGWLKGLVVGVTGGTGMQMTMPTGPVLPTMTPALPPATTHSKRKRDDTGE